MKKIACFLIALCVVGAARAERIYRSEFLTYDTREAAENRDTTGISKFIPYNGEATVDIPTNWFDSFIYLRLDEGMEEHDLTGELRQGENDFSKFEGRSGFLFAQEKRSIRDYTVRLVPDSLGRDFGMLELDIIVQNGFNYPEPVTIGWDLYDPTGKLLDYSVTEITVDGRSVDTLRFSPFVYHTYEHTWPGELYNLTLYTKRDGTFHEYIPVRVGFNPPVYDGTMEVVYNDKPQPASFYDRCDEQGILVIDQADINFPDRRDDRTVTGTPSNDPAMLEHYLERVRSMYYRSRNHTCIVGFSLGTPSGNGYNMYKSYQWLKSQETHRPVIYQDAAGEWNSDF